MVLVGLLAVGGLLLYYAGRHLTFFYDEWAFALTRRGSSLGTYLDPHNGHLVLFPVLVYKLLFAIVGLRHYWPYRVVTIVLHLLSCGLLYALVRPRLGRWLALGPVVLLLFMGSAWQVLLWPFQIAYLGSVAGGLAALLALEAPNRRRAQLAAALLTWAVISSGVGLAFVVACGVSMLVRRQWRLALWTVVPPLVLFAVWYVGWATGEHTTLDAILGAPQYAATAAASASAGIAGLDQSWGPPLAVGLLLVGAAAWVSRPDRAPTPLLLAIGAGALTFWILAAITRSDSPDPSASRYLYVGGVFILLLCAEARVGRARHPGWIAILGLLVIGAVLSNLHQLRAGERGLRTSTVSVRASLGAVELAASTVSPAFLPDAINAPQITAGPYLAAVHDLGSPALTLRELETSPESQRQRADVVLAHAENVTPVAAAGGGACAGVATTDVTAGAAEFTVTPGRELQLRAGRAGAVSIWARRLAAGYGAPLATVPPGQPVSMKFPVDRVSLPWHVRLASAQPLVVCPR